GAFIKACPGTPKYICCCYFVVELAVGCPFDCSYCYLQQYQNFPATIFYVNFDKLFRELDSVLSKYPDKLFRIGTGEYADSLYLDKYINYSREIADYLSKKFKNYLIEFKTKHDKVDNLLERVPTGHEVVSWSVNPQKVMDVNEHLTASLDERLEAAKKCADRGYWIGLHFDPIIYFEGWEQAYSEVVRKIYQKIDSQKIIWISLGTLRFNPHLKSIIETRHPESKIVYAEMIKGLDGKMRYLKDERIRMFKKVAGQIQKHDKDAFIYFCMEDSQVWKEVLGKEVHSSKDVDRLFLERRKLLI
ncbi:radical SAM protein, partial [bacterium]